MEGLDTDCGQTWEDVVFLAAGIGLPGAVDWVMMRFFAIVQLVRACRQPRASPSSWSSVGTSAA